MFSSLSQNEIAILLWATERIAAFLPAIPLFILTFQARRLIQLLSADQRKPPKPPKFSR